MRRRAYPFGRYLVRDNEIGKIGKKLKAIIEKLGFPVIKYDTKNEKTGTLIIAVNKKVMDFFKQRKPPGRIQMILGGYSLDTSSFREMDMDSQRVGIELYLWPFDDNLLLEIFVLPYMGHINTPEIFGLTESRAEEITDWYLCEETWEHIIPKITKELDMEPVQVKV